MSSSQGSSARDLETSEPRISQAPSRRVKAVFGDDMATTGASSARAIAPASPNAQSNTKHKSRGFIMGFLLGRNKGGDEQVRHSHRHGAEKAPASALPPMRETLENDDQLRLAFAEYAKTHYLNDSMSFLQMIIDYKNFFWEKPDSWRKHKIQVIYSTYLEVGSTLEVNVSEDCRKRCKRKYDLVQSSKHPDCKILFELFDECEGAVEDMLGAGAWRKFISETRAREPSLGSQSTPG